MDHTPGQRQWMDVERFRIYTQRNQRWSDEYLAQVVAERQDMQERNAERNRPGCSRCAATATSRSRATTTPCPSTSTKRCASGISISEFPTTVAAALAAREHGLGIVMGAPNLVRGGSHSGNVSALDAGTATICSTACRRTTYRTLCCTAPFCCATRPAGVCPRRSRRSSRNPARLVGLNDRGEIAPGKRADFVRVRETTTRATSAAVPVPLATWRQGVRIA